MDLAREAQKRETGGIGSEGECRGGSRDLRSESVISGILRFHLNSPVSNFLHEYHLFCVNLRRIHVMVRKEFMRVTILRTPC